MEKGCERHRAALLRWHALPAFGQVPPDWYPAYYEYRLVMETVRADTQGIHDVCFNGGGKLYERYDEAVIARLIDSTNRLRTLYHSVRARSS